MPNKPSSTNRVIQAFQACRDALVRSIMKMSVEQQDVDDILQETFARALDSDKKRTIESPKDYLFVVSRNLVFQRLSKQSKEIINTIDEAILDCDQDKSLEQELYQKRRFDKFSQALKKLPEKQRRAILLRKLYGLSHKEIAGKMSVSVSSVEKYIAAGVKTCKQSLYTQGYQLDQEENQQSESAKIKRAQVRALVQERKNESK